MTAEQTNIAEFSKALGNDISTESVMNYGVTANGIDLDNAAFSLAMQQEVERTLFVPKRVYKFNKPLTIDVSKLKMMGDRSLLDFSAVPANSGACLVVTGAGTGDPYANVVNTLSSLRLVGPGQNVAGVTGVVFDTPTEGGTSHYSFYNVAISGFAVNVELRNNAYIQNMICTNIYAGGIGIYAPAGMTNAGERITFTDTTIFNNKVGIRVDHGEGDTYLTNCSLDYNEVQLISNNSLVELHGCHIEGKNYAAAPIQVNGYGANVRFFGGRFLNTFNDVKPPHYFECNANGTIEVLNADIHNIGLLGRKLVGGTSPQNVRIVRPKGYEVFQTPLTVSDHQNLLSDADFAGDVPSDNWLAGGTAIRVSRFRLNGGDGNADVEVKTTGVNPRAGTTKSLLIAKRYGANSAAACQLVVRCSPGEDIAVSMYLSRTGSESGLAFFTYTFAGGLGYDASSMPTFARTQPLGTINVDTATLSTVAASWSLHELAPRPIQVPVWAEYLVLDINLVSMTAGGLKISSPVITQYNQLPPRLMLMPYDVFRTTAGQPLSVDQKTNALTNLGLAGPSDYRNSKLITIPSGNDWVSLGTPTRGMLLIALEGQPNGESVGLYLALKPGAFQAGTVTAIGDAAHFSNGTKFSFRWNADSSVEISNVTGGVTANVRIINAL